MNRSMVSAGQSRSSVGSTAAQPVPRSMLCSSISAIRRTGRYLHSGDVSLR
jgi:hypothetical protein